MFAIDIMTCSRCGGRMRLVEIANSRDDIARVLANIGLRQRPFGIAALVAGLYRRKVNRVLDADIRGFFDASLTDAE